MKISGNSLYDSFWGIRCVWLRYFDVFRKSLLYGIITTFTEPVLYLLSFGLGLGSMIGDLTIGDRVVSYRQFILAGIASQTILFQGFFEAAYGGYIRMYYQRIFKAMAVTPVTLSEVLWGELLWDSTKSSFATFSVLVMGSLLGDFSIKGALIALPFSFLCSLLFAGLGLLVAAKAKTIDQISYPQYLLVFPMFLFCGIFFPLQNLPSVAQKLAWVLPLTSVASIMRTLTLGFPLEPQAIPMLLIWGIGLVYFSRRAMIQRLAL